MKGVETWTHLETNWSHDKIQGDAEFEHSWMTCDGGSCWRMKVAAGKQNHQSVQTSLSKTSLFFDLRGGAQRRDTWRLDDQSQSITKCLALTGTSGVSQETVSGQVCLFLKGAD